MKALKTLALIAVAAAPLAHADEASNAPAREARAMEEIVVTASQPRTIETLAPVVNVDELKQAIAAIGLEVKLPSLPSASGL